MATAATAAGTHGGRDLVLGSSLAPRWGVGSRQPLLELLGLVGAPWYQNKECKAYKLTLDNDKEPYYWTSNLQLVSKVYMRKHPSQPRTHSINANDKKMVNAKVKALS